MLRRDFLKAVAAFTAATTAAKAVVAAATPQAKAGDWLRENFLCQRPWPAGAALVPPEFATALEDALNERSLFERTLIDCLRDGSLRLVGVTCHRADYSALYVAGGEHGPEQARHDALMRMYDDGLIVIESVTVINRYDGVQVDFSICTGARR